MVCLKSQLIQSVEFFWSVRDVGSLKRKYQVTLIKHYNPSMLEVKLTSLDFRFYLQSSLELCGKAAELFEQVKHIERLVLICEEAKSFSIWPPHLYRWVIRMQNSFSRRRRLGKTSRIQRWARRQGFCRKL